MRNALKNIRVQSKPDDNLGLNAKLARHFSFNVSSLFKAIEKVADGSIRSIDNVPFVTS